MGEGHSQTSLSWLKQVTTLRGHVADSYVWTGQQGARALRETRRPQAEGHRLTCAHAPQRGPQDSLETGVCTSAAGSPAAARSLSPSRLHGALCPALRALQRSPVWRHTAARSRATWGFHAGSPDAPPGKEKRLGHKPRSLTKVKACSFFSKEHYLFQNHWNGTQPRLSLAVSLFPRATGGKRLGVLHAPGRGGGPAKGRVRAEGPERGRWEQEGHPEGLSQEGCAPQLRRERLQDGAVHMGSDPPRSLAHAARVRLRPWRVCTLPTQTDPESPSLEAAA